MIKYLFYAINPLLFLLISLFRREGDVTITAHVPSNIQAATEVEFAFTINKSSLVGYGIFECKLPAGFVAIGEIDPKPQAAYAVADNIVKWTWDELPDAEELTVKVAVVAGETATGNQKITANFYYEEDNEKKEVAMPAATIRVLSQSAETPGQPDIEARQEPVGIVSATRTITRISKKEYLVRIKINKGLTTGFAKFSDDAHDNFVYLPQRTDGGSYSLSDQKIKFVWTNVPDADVLEIVYSITRNSADETTLHGEYTYLEHNQMKTHQLKPDLLEALADEEKETSRKSEIVSVKPDSSKIKQAENKKLKVESEKLKIEKEKPKAENQKLQVENKKPKNEKNTDKQTANENKQRLSKNLEKKEGEMSYMVQIGAFTKAKVNAQGLKKKFKITETITSDMQDGFSKFMVGSHGEYKNARDHREQIRANNGVKTAFVVAYNGAKRISVQEALMITNQKWFK
ncbi:MAG: hypothetical protein KF900_13400 [Bacteroidetes bacterium]|nr:hypothetical protein [Bacteroidota bacterium]